MSDPTIAVTQVLVDQEGKVLRVLRGGKPVPAYVGMHIDALKAALEAEGWVEQGRWAAPGAPEQTQIAFKRA